MTNPFLTTEGDNWYGRNEAAMRAYSMKDDPVWKLCQRHLRHMDLIVDLGCSSGERAMAFSNGGLKRTVGIDVSHNAIQVAKHRTHDLSPRPYDWRIGSWPLLAQIPEPIGNKLLLTIFVWHWIPREELASMVAAITNYLKPGDLFCIGDFCVTPQTFERRQYHHLPGEDVWTWKAQYHEMFRALGLFTIMDAISVDEKDHRRSYYLLRREDAKAIYKDATPPLPPQSSP